MKKILPLFALALLAFVTGCQSTASLAAKLNEFDQLGIKRATITGKFSNTEYVRTEANGKIISTLDHSNAWIPKVHIERERPAASQP